MDQMVTKESGKLSSQSRLQFIMLGRPSILVETTAGISQVLGPGKPLALLAYLACSPHRRADREHLLDLLWSDQTTSRAKHALTQMVWYLRQRLGDEILVTDSRSVGLGTEIKCDRDEFLSCVDANDLNGIVSCYSGDFLPGFAAPGGARFENWAEMERVRLRSAFVRAAEELARQAMGAGRGREAVVLAKRARDCDPWREDGWRLVIEAQMALGDVIGACLEAESLRQAFDGEGYGLAPVTLEVLASVGANHVAASEHPAQGMVAELIGRGVEFAACLAAWRNASRGNFMNIHFGAPAGLGKTRLIEDISHRLGRDGAKIVSVSGKRGSSSLPYSLACELAAALIELPGSRGISPDSAGSLRALHPALSAWLDVTPDRSEGDEALRRRTLAMADLIEAVADEQPLAVFVDDLHWVDNLSLMLLQSALDRPKNLSLLIVTASRPTSKAHLDLEPNAVYELEPLSTEEIGSMIASLGRLPSDPWAVDLPERARTATGGSPLLVLETLNLAIEQQALVLQDGEWRVRNLEGLKAVFKSRSALVSRIQSLTASQQRILLVLSVAGVPLSEVLIMAAITGVRDVTSEDLEELQQAGFIKQSGDRWLPTHDEIAAQVLESVSEQEMQVAHVALGRALAADANAEEHLMLRAGRHLHLGKANRDLALLFTRFVVTARRAGDRRPLTELARTFTGHEGLGNDFQFLKRALPWTHRVGLYSASRVTIAAVAAILIVMGVFAGVYGRSAAPPEPDLILFTMAPDGHGLTRTDLFEDELRSATSIELSEKVLGWTSGIVNPPVVSPDGSRVAFAMDVGRHDSHDGGYEILVASEDRESRRLTFSPGDDFPMAWSPDGRYLAVSTARWNNLSRYDLAAIHLESGNWHRMTNSDGLDGSLAWHESGASVAFVRHFVDELRPAEVCRSSFDGTLQSCIAVPGYDFRYVLSWIDDETVLAAVRDDSLRLALAEVDLWSGVATPIGWLEAARPVFAGKWLITSCVEQSGSLSILCLSHRETGGRRIPMFYGNDALVEPRIAAAVPSTDYVDSLEIIAPNYPLATGVRNQLRANVYNAGGDLLAFGQLTWSVADTAVAVVDSSGSLLPLSVGGTSVSVTAGGWRSASVAIEIETNHRRELLHETWVGSIARNWVVFGIPRPIVIDDGRVGRAFLNNGDGSFHSGAYTRERFDAERGLGASAVISATLTEPQWQLLLLYLTSELDELELGRWNHEDGPLPSNRPRLNHCYVTYPNSDGFRGREFARWETAEEREVIAVSPTMRDGLPHTVTIQIFPDGTCGFAIDGIARARSRTSIRLDRPFRMVLSGRSDQTEMLVGEVQIWEGVNTQIDWLAAEPR